MLNAEDKRRHARHLLLAEVGEAGQARLLAAGVRIAVGADPRVAAVAEDYLVRAGMQPAALPNSCALVLPGVDAVTRLAGDAVLQEAAAALAGAYAAVEAIKQCVGVGEAAHLPTTLRLTGRGT